MARVERVCVYCGAADRVAEPYRQAARQTGALLAKAGIELVFGGGRVGLMGLVADAALAAGGRVTGIIPGFLHGRELGHTGVSELIVVGSMHERKQRMFERSDAFAVLPGGLGTLDETLECITWKQLDLHDRPIVILDIDGYWRPLTALIEQAIGAGFAGGRTRTLYEVVAGPEALMAALAAAPEPRLPPAPERV